MSFISALFAVFNSRLLKLAAMIFCQICQWRNWHCYVQMRPGRFGKKRCHGWDLVLRARDQLKITKLLKRVLSNMDWGSPGYCR
ncbi:hypothetical protein C8R42DRAFT_663982 [Lentinula raphanica]|nr:hypothetical protein C8R42DRAFT_663982 [Lentinula raphanica]